MKILTQKLNETTINKIKNKKQKNRKFSYHLMWVSEYLNENDDLK
jgi:hypothetical protein